MGDLSERMASQNPPWFRVYCYIRQLIQTTSFSMTKINSSTIQDAEMEAQRVSVTKWFWIGLLLHSFGVLIVYLRTPKASTALLAKYEGDDRWLFERSYAETLKAREIKKTWIGFAVCCVLGLLFFLFYVLLILQAPPTFI
jgi:hypothetical protein